VRIPKFYETERAQRLEENMVDSGAQHEERTRLRDTTPRKLLEKLGKKLKQCTKRC
jgi:hypothetical protein